MLLGKVLGSVWATRKEEVLEGMKFLVVETVEYASRRPGRTMVAIDEIGAGVGETVLLTFGSSARKVKKEIELPIDAVIVGIVDKVEIEETEIED